ncbi:MAG: hypothetical protein JW874_15945 [Spirochaetales bacterium]|nr:hypothetical protein [Spirochaetales bacterium]
MSESDIIQELKIESLILSVSRKDDKTVMVWKGESDEKNPSNTLIPFFEKIIGKIEGDFEMVFNNLDYMNSSTIHPLIMFIKDLDEKNIKTTIFYNKESKWQEASFRALHALTNVLTNIQVTGI